jgi:hypothetical protein
MGDQVKKAVDELREIANGDSKSLRELDEGRSYFRLRLNKVLSNLPPGEIVEVTGPGHLHKEVVNGTIPLFPEDRESEIESPGDLAAQEARSAL